MDDKWSNSLISGAVLFSIVGIVSALLGVSLDPRAVVSLMAIFAALAYVSRRGADLEVGFVVIGFALLLTINEYLLPDVVSDVIAGSLAPFHSMLVSVTGVDLSVIEPLYLFVASVIFTFALIYTRVRLAGEKSFLDTTTDKTVSEMANYARRYVSATRVIVFGLFSLLVLFAAEVAELLGAVGEVIGYGPLPLVVSNVWSMFLGYAALDGQLPGIGEVPIFVDIGASMFAILAVGAFGLAVASVWDSSGPTIQRMRDWR